MLRCIFETWLFRPFQELSLTLYSTVVTHEITWSWRAIARRRRPYGLVRHAFNLPHSPSPPRTVGEKWMRDERTPKDVCGEARRARAIFSLSYPDSLLTEVNNKNCLPCFIPCSAVEKMSRPNKAVPPARKSSLPAQPQPNSFFLSCQLELRNYVIVRHTDFYSRVLQRVNETAYALFLWCNFLMI